MKFEIPPNTLPRLERMIRRASASNGTAPLRVRLSIQKTDGTQPSSDEVDEVRAILAGYGADGPLDDWTPKGSPLPGSAAVKR